MNEDLIAEAELGEEARQFLESDLGKCLMGMADQEAILAQEALGEVDPHNTIEIQRLQNHIKVSKWFRQWLYELLDKGESALEVFKHGSKE